MANLPTIDAIRNELSANLVISGTITMTQDQVINVGEEFRVTFRVSNDLLYLNGTFTDVWLFVNGNRFATPRDGEQINIDLGEIPPRTSRTSEVWFRALTSLEQLVGLNLPEPYAGARVRAQFDIQQLFGNIWQENVFVTDIN